MKDYGINVLITGTGGQGVLLAGDIIARAFVTEGYDVKASALRGMAQRGGTIFSHIRAGKKIYSPLIPKGQADLLVALELEECIRQVDYLKKEGQIFFLDRYLPQGAAKDGVAKRSCAITKSLKENFKARALQIPYDVAVKSLRDVKKLNIFTLGVLSNYLPVSKNSWLKMIAEVFSRDQKSTNLSAFYAGRSYGGKIKAK